MRKSGAKTKAAAKRLARERDLLSELCSDHGYTFADSLPSKDRVTMMMSTSIINGKTTRTIEACPVIKLMIPSESELGRQILAVRGKKPSKVRT